MTITISRLYNSYPDAQAAIDRLEAAGVSHGDISVLASNADEWYRGDQGNKAASSRTAISITKMIGKKLPQPAQKSARLAVARSAR